MSETSSGVISGSDGTLPKDFNLHTKETLIVVRPDSTDPDVEHKYTKERL